MLVPAIAFAWWLVSLPTFPLQPASSHGRVGRAERASLEARVRGGATAEDSLAGATEPAKASAAIDGEWSGERVMLKVVTPEIVRVAQGLLDLPMGDERFVGIDGHKYVFVLERHYHPPGFVGAPNGWHKGVTVYELR
jgi:hypothetical protein